MTKLLTHKRIILTSQNLIQQGVVIETLLKSLVVDKTIKLDDILDKIGNIGIMHIDTEGWEPQVLSGATYALKKTIYIFNWIEQEILEQKIISIKYIAQILACVFLLGIIFFSIFKEAF